MLASTLTSADMEEVAALILYAIDVATEPDQRLTPLGKQTMALDVMRLIYGQSPDVYPPDLELAVGDAFAARTKPVEVTE